MYITKHPFFLIFHIPTLIISRFLSLIPIFFQVFKYLYFVNICFRLWFLSSGFLLCQSYYCFLANVLLVVLSSVHQCFFCAHCPIYPSLISGSLVIGITASGSSVFIYVVLTFGYDIPTLVLLILFQFTCYQYLSPIIWPLLWLCGMSFPPGCAESETIVLPFFFSILMLVLVVIFFLYEDGVPNSF